MDEKAGVSAARSVRASRRDVFAAGVTTAAILLFVGTGGSVMSSITATISGQGDGTDRSLVVALLLNIALILFGWRRYRDLAEEVQERTAAEERARQLASRDPLTGFLNRRSLAESGAELLQRAERRDKTVAMLLLDLDHFKTVNDMNGHAAGDALLCQVAEQIGETMPPGALTARFGGDEFACAFLYDANAPDIVDRIVERLLSRLATPFMATGALVHISGSIGIARSEDDCATVDSLVRRADIAMYHAKGAGRNRYCWFDSSMEMELKARNDLEIGLRSAIPAGEIVPYFEQQIDLKTGKLLGFEVLARWEHPSRGMISPELFIPIAEETGLIGELSTSIMRQAFIAARDWDASITLSVNISPGELRDPYLAQKIVRLLVETGFPAGRLEIEITETSLFENLSLAQSIIGSLKNQGIRIALDDFGTGYSSLAHLRALPFDRIKIDRSFVTSINDNSESAAIVNAIARLGDSLNLPITAEGVEDQAIQDRLNGLGCSKGQGWHFGKPVGIAGARVLLAERNLLAARTAEPEVNSLRQAG
ncbi:EAL domain-containing protein [Sphingomonas gilva]|uniref:EAL domain-containing protein n=1 Tax=Sphingomonas gilva TaxID=2305907 RepID=A0A396RLC3_9SPHN|nr:EAL domain-containing protein [Sphingomonas gilva]RHW17108.1 EAL domain-containing protein [Sphingomonas gilva]